jgi:hypothetical protein
MAEVTAPQAAEILDTSHPTVFRHVKEGRLSARREGLRRDIWIEVETLRQFAKQYGYRFDAELAARYAK